MSEGKSLLEGKKFLVPYKSLSQHNISRTKAEHHYKIYPQNRPKKTTYILLYIWLPLFEVRINFILNAFVLK